MKFSEKSVKHCFTENIYFTLDFETIVDINKRQILHRYVTMQIV